MNAVSVSVWMFCKYIKYNRMDGPFDSGTRRLYYSIWFRLDVFAGLILVDRIHEKCATNFINSHVYVLRSEKREFRNWHVRLFSTVNAMAKKKRVREMKSNRLAIGWVQSICLIVLAWLVSHLHKRRWCGSNIQWHVLHTHTHKQIHKSIHSIMVLVDLSVGDCCKRATTIIVKATTFSIRLMHTQFSRLVWNYHPFSLALHRCAPFIRCLVEQEMMVFPARGTHQVQKDVCGCCYQ